MEKFDMIMEKFDLVMEKIRDLFEKIDNIAFLNKKPSTKFLAIAFSAVIVLLLSFSLVTVISERGGEEEETTDVSAAIEETTFAGQLPSEELEGNFLLVLTQDGYEKIELISLVRLDSAEKKVSISFVDKNQEINVNGVTGNMQEHLDNGGINELMWSVGQSAGVTIERYIFGDEQNFIDFIKKLGGVELDVSEKIQHRHRGIDFIIEEGVQTLSADMTLKYFAYLCKTFEEGPEKLVRTMISIGKKMFDTENDEELEKSFTSMMRNFETNISVVDFTTYKGAIKALASSENLVEISIVLDPSQLS